MNALAQLAVALLVTVAVGLLDDQGWPSFVIGAVLALALWVMLLAGCYAGSSTGAGRGTVNTRDYALAAAIGVVLGYLLFRFGDSGAWWAPGFILAGVLVPGVVAAQRGAAPRQRGE